MIITRFHNLTLSFSLLFLLLFSVAPDISTAAESTADVSVNAGQKEKLRQQIMGGAADKMPVEEYTVGYRDILHVSVYGEGSMSASEGIQPGTAADPSNNAMSGGNFLRGRGSGIEVRIDGRISLRHIGDVSVVGMTLTQIADYLKQLYSTIYDNPSLTVTLVQSNSLQYTIMGQVVAPGLFHLDYPLTIVRAVARAGGFTEWANSEITVIRQGDGGQNNGGKHKFDFDDFLSGKDLEKNILIKSGDVIVVH